MLRNENFTLQKDFKYQFYSQYGLLLPVRKHFLKFYRFLRLRTAAINSDDFSTEQMERPHRSP